MRRILGCLSRGRYYLTNELPLQLVADREKLQAVEQSIPTTVYQTWEDRYFGKTHARELEKFRDINPELSFVIFDQQQLGAYMAEHWGEHPIHRIFANVRFGPMRADIFRYCILFERGGYYFDINKACTTPLTALHPRDASALISYEGSDCIVLPDDEAMGRMQHPDKIVCQWGLAFAPGHPVLARMIDNICHHYDYFRNRSFSFPKSAILAFTGPGMFTKTVREAFSAGDHAGVAQAGIDFNGSGIPRLNGSKVRYLTVPAYAAARNAVIVT